jgi:hypothetical protein
MTRCDPERVATFDYLDLAPEFLSLAKPVQRALVNNHIFNVQDLADWRRADLAALHGIGPSAFPPLDAILAMAGSGFREAN